MQALAPLMQSFCQFKLLHDLNGMYKISILQIAVCNMAQAII